MGALSCHQRITRSSFRCRSAAGLILPVKISLKSGFLCQQLGKCLIDMLEDNFVVGRVAECLQLLTLRLNAPADFLQVFMVFCALFSEQRRVV